MDSSLPSHRPIEAGVALTSQWPVTLTGGTVTGKFKWYVRVFGLCLLGAFLSVVIGVVVGLLFNSGDVGILTATGLFVVSALGALYYGRRQVVKHAVILLNQESFAVVSETRTIVNWSCQEIRRVQCDWIRQGAGFLPSGFDKVSVECKGASIVFAMDHEDALECVETMKTITTNSVYTGAMIESHVPSTSDRPDQVWRTKLRAELRNACWLIAFGLFGSAFLYLLIYAIWTGQPLLRGGIRGLVLMIFAAIFGPFSLFLGVKFLIVYFSRRRRFNELSKEGRITDVNDLISEIYNEPKS